MSKKEKFSLRTCLDGKRHGYRQGKSILGPAPQCTFGPKAVTQPDITRDYTLDPENKKLIWTRPPETVLIIKKTGSDTDNAFRSMSSWLIKVKRMLVYVETKLLSSFKMKNVPSYKAIYNQLKEYKCSKQSPFNSNIIDLVITIGGDGTLLYAASLFQSSMPPVIAFKSGSLGFLTGHDLEEFSETIDSVLAGNSILMLRSRLRCNIERNRSSPPLSKVSGEASYEDFGKLRINGNECDDVGVTSSFLVLNEVVVNRGSSQYLCNLDLFLERRQITSVQGDGLIISTPTGSTAYAVAAGASMVHPDVPSIMITPICPHSLSFRPIIVPSGAELQLTVSRNSRGSAWVSFDGSKTVEIKPGDYVTIRTSVHPAPCVCKSNPFDDWFDSLSVCLHWNSRQPQKKLEDD